MKNKNNIGMEMVEATLKVPHVKVNRAEFLSKTFENKTDEFDKLIAEGPASIFTIEQLDKIADKRIHKIILESSSVSFTTGLPGFAALPITLPADIIQFWVFALRLAQEVAYIYGYDNILDENDEFSEEGKNTIIIFLGIMLGVNAAGATIRLMSSKISKQLATSIPRIALTKTFYYPIIKSVLKTFGVSLTKKTFAKGISKTIPVIGGVAAGSINYAMLSSQSKKLKNELRKILIYTEDDYIIDVDIIENEIEMHQDNEVSIDCKLDELTRLGDLLEKNIITEEEFKKLKKSII